MNLYRPKSLTKARERARAAGAAVNPARIARRATSPQSVIEIAKEKATNVNRGRASAAPGRSTRLLLGSVSRKLVTLAPVPVIVVP